MALQRKTMRVYLADGDPDGIVVTISLPDQLRGELEAKKQSIQLDLPMHIATVWAWCALTRMGLYNAEFQQFLNVDCLDWENAGDVDVDPTQPAAPGGSPSPSPSASPEPTPTGG